jgi:hypothetical protein
MAFDLQSSVSPFAPPAYELSVFPAEFLPLTGLFLYLFPFVSQSNILEKNKHNKLFMLAI